MSAFPSDKEPQWYDILALPQIKQGDQAWLNARMNKQSSSDFAAVVPCTEKYIGHIIKMWNYEEVDSDGKVQKPFAYNEAKTCYDYSYEEYIRKKALFVEKDEENNDDDDNGVINSFGGGATAIGHRYENIIRNLTAQHLQRIIDEIGWVEGLRTSNAGVSPDGIVHIDDKNVNRGQHFYFFDGQQSDTNANMLFRTSGAKNFEAKTIVSREMVKKVPIKYHIQVERTAYELHLKSSIYTEARFLELCEKDWMVETNKVKDIVLPITTHFTYGILLHCTALKSLTTRDGVRKAGETWHVWPSIFIRDIKHFLMWRDTMTAYIKSQTLQSVRVVPVYFKVEALWCCEIPLWEKYHEIYGPLIHKEAERLHYLAKTDEGQQEYNLKYCNTDTTLKKRAAPRPRRSRQTLFLEDMSLQPCEA